MHRLYVFGSNGEGQLGVPSEDIISKPVLAESWPVERSIISVSSGDNHTLILSPDGSVHFAGSTKRGQFGPEESQHDRCEHIKTSPWEKVLLCAAACESCSYIVESNGKHSIVIEGTGHWGESGFEKIHALPHPVVDFAAGGWHYVVTLLNGDVLGWGKSRLDQLGPKLAAQQRVTKPTLIEEGISFKPVKVVCGKEFTYLASDPTTGEHSLLGRDKFGLRSSMPAHIKGWKSIGATWNAIFVLFEDGSLTAWGKENMWKLLPKDLPPIEKMAVGSEHVLALTRDGKLISWGWGKHGNCGDLMELGPQVKNDMVDGFWNEIGIPGRIRFLGAGYCTSFVLVDFPE